jgi:ergothioneine biosynthesis protein EgtB
VAFVSPPKWHLAHTTWFFETFVLPQSDAGYKPWHPRYAYLFNSYYEAIGERVARHQRGTLSRPAVAEILAYRAHVDEAMMACLERDPSPHLSELIELGLQHEQQHQELLLTDTKYILGLQPLRPAFVPADMPALAYLDPAREHAAANPSLTQQVTWQDVPGGLHGIGHDGRGFAFDNEGGRHLQHLRPFQIRQTLVTNHEYLAFMADDAYRRPELWHAEAWEWLQAESIEAPLYWWRDESAPQGWSHYTLRGPQFLPPDGPVTHLSFYEAHAYARWAGARLPTEFEWEAAMAQHAQAHPQQANRHWGQRWEWTGSAYLPYPGFESAHGAIGEYNGKFMANQMVLRGASFATPPGHARLSYRNFFHPPMRWQYTGIRLARD